MSQQFQDRDGVLRRGDSGTAVANWQRFLISQGFQIEADGDFGSATDAATRHFQDRHGLKNDGLAGPATLDKAELLLASHTPGTISSSSLLPEPHDTDQAKNQPRLSRVHPTLAMRVMQTLNAAAADGYTLVVTWGLRTFAEQNALYAQGRTRGGQIVTGARGGQSYHNYGLAADVAFRVRGTIDFQRDDALYNKIGAWARPAGLEWGGDWPRFVDRPHLQLPGLPGTKILLPVFQTGGLKAVWERFVR